MLFRAEKSEHLHITKATGQVVTMRGVPIPQVKLHRHLGLVMNNKLSWTDPVKDVHGTCSRMHMIGVLRRLRRRRLQGTKVKAIFIGAIRPRMEYVSEGWSGGPTQSLQRLQDSFCNGYGIPLPPLQTRFHYHGSLSGSALQDEIKSCTAVLIHTSSPASFSNGGIFIPKVRVPRSSHKKTVSIVELCPTVDSPLDRTSEGNPSNTLTKFKTRLRTHLHIWMSTVAFFKLQMICFIVFFLINS